MIKTFIILNRKYEQERYNHLKKQITEFNLNNILDINYLDNLTWKSEITDKFMKTHCIDDYVMKKHGRSMKKKPLTKGEVSLFINYIKILENIIKNNSNEKYILILESDVIFKENFETNLNEILNNLTNLNDLDILNIGEGSENWVRRNGYPKTKPILVNNYKFYKENVNKWAEGIIWKVSSIKKFLDYYNKTKIIDGPIDTKIDIFAKENENFNLYWPEKTIVAQGTYKKFGLFKSTLL